MLRRFAAPLAIAFGVACGCASTRNAFAAEPLGPAVAPVRTTAGDAKGTGPIVVWPTLTPAGDESNGLPLHKPTTLEPTLSARAEELDATLRDAVADLGYALDLADPGPTSGHMRDEDLVARAEKDTWVVSARLEPSGSSLFVLRIVAVPPASKELRIRVETVKGEEVAVRGLVMLRDLLTTTPLAPPNDEARCLGCANLANVSTTTMRSPGRAVLAVNGAVFGGYVAYSLERASTANGASPDPRVLYPLLALGTGLGVGMALLVGDEWDLSSGDAWFLAAGAWWGTAAGILVSTGQSAQPNVQFAYGAASGLGGIALATVALTRRKMDEGDALLAHSGGAFGTFVGGLVDLAYRGTTTNVTPSTGAGLGAAIGVVGAGTLASFVQVSPTRMILIDTGAALGALAGAAAASPLIFQDTDSTKSRLFLASTLGGTVIGGTLGWAFTRDKAVKPAGGTATLFGEPFTGVIGMSQTPTRSVPAYGVGWSGSF